MVDKKSDFSFDKAFSQAFPSKKPSPPYDYSAAFEKAFPAKPTSPPYSYKTLTPDRLDPEMNANFVVEIDGVEQGRFQEVGGLTAEIEPIDFIAGDDMKIRKIPGRAKYSNIVLKRGIISSRHSDLWKWMENVINGVQDRRSGSIILQDDSGNEVLRYNFYLGFPVKWTGLNLNSNSAAALTIEELEIACEWFEKA